MKVHILDPKDLLSNIGFLETFNFLCDTNNLHEVAVIWVLLHYVKETLAIALNRYICSKDCSLSFAASAPDGNTRSRKLLRNYKEVLNYLFQKLVTDQAFVENDEAILRYIQSSNLTPQQYADDLTAKSFKVLYAYDKSTLNDLIIEGVGEYIGHSLSSYCALNSEGDEIDITFQVKLLISCQKRP